MIVSSFRPERTIGVDMPRDPRPSELADRIEAAADLIGTKGWCTGEFRRGERYCMIGAVKDVTRSFKVEYLVWLALLGSLSADYGAEAVSTGPEAWNDEQRDSRKVRRAMLRTAKRLREHTLRLTTDTGVVKYVYNGGK